EAVRPENDDCKIECEHDQRLVRRIEQEPTERLDKSDQYASEKAAGDAAEPAERHGNECQQSKVRAHLGKNVIESREHRAGYPDAAESDAPPQREHALGRNPHHSCRLAILRGRLQAQTRFGTRDEPPECGERQQADAASDQLRLADKDRADLHAPGNERIGDGTKVGRPEELRAGAQRDTEAERAADLGEHRRLQQLPDDAEVRQYAGKGEDNYHERQRQHRIEAGKSPEPERREHGEHEKLTMREIDDFHQPENQRQADRHKRIDQSHQQPADDSLKDELSRHQRARTSRQLNRLTSTCKKPPIRRQYRKSASVCRTCDAELWKQTHSATLSLSCGFAFEPYPEFAAPMMRTSTSP